MTHLRDRAVFLSASFPSGKGGEDVRPYDAAAVADAVTAVVRAVLHANGRLVFGAHPTISPLVLLVAGEIERKGAVDIWQSRHFEHEIPAETKRLVDLGYGELHWVDDPTGDRAEALEEMRRAMLSHAQIDTAVFIGGMGGVTREYDLLGELRPDVPRVPLTAPGGAARRLAFTGAPGDPLGHRLDSERYPALARELVAGLAARD